MTKKEEELFFVDVTNSDDLRRTILECSKDILEILKSYESFKATNSQKQKEIEDLKVKVKQISKLISKLKSDLPSIKIKTEKKKSTKKEMSKPKESEPPVIKKPKSEIEKLQSELDEVEAKLNEISQ